MRVTDLRGRTRLGLPVLLLVAAMTLGACADAKRQLGLVNTPPDEFAVVSRPPLSLPPDFALRPPRPGAEPQEAVIARQQTRQAVFGLDDASAIDGSAIDGPIDGDGEIRLASGPAEPAGPRAAPRLGVETASVGEAALLGLAGADQAAPGIRRIIDRESAVLADADDRLIDRLLSLDVPPPGTVVDADAEARRLRENQALGRPVTEGETPSIERKERGLLEGIF